MSYCIYLIEELKTGMCQLKKKRKGWIDFLSLFL